MHVKVKSSRTTWLLFALAIAAAGAIAAWRVAERSREEPPPAREAGVVEIELVE